MLNHLFLPFGQNFPEATWYTLYHKVEGRTKKLKSQKPGKPFGKYVVVTPSLCTLGFLYEYTYVLLEGKNVTRLHLIFKSVVTKIREAAYMVSLCQFPKSLISAQYWSISENCSIRYFHQQQYDIQCLCVPSWLAGNCIKEPEEVLFPVCNPRINVCNDACEVPITHWTVTQ